MTLLMRKSVFAAAIETTPGTAETLAAGDGVFNAYNVQISPNIEVEEREGQAGFNRLAGVAGTKQGTCTFRTDVGWDGTTTMPSWADILFPACGWVETSQVYNPTTEAPGTNVKTLTIGKYEDGRLLQLHGAVGTFQWVLPAGKMSYIDWTFTGAYSEVTDVSLIAPTYPTALPIKFSSATVQFNSVNLKVAQVTVDAGNNVIMREDASTATGYSTALITDRNPRITIDPEAVLVATNDIYGLFSAGTQASFDIQLDGPSDSTIDIDAPKAQIMSASPGDRNGMVIDSIELACQKNDTTTDKELFFTFAEATV